MTEKKKCKAKNRQGKPCGRWAVPGADVCRFHGGAAPQVLAAAQRRLQKAEAEKLLGDYLAEAADEIRGMDPAQHLLDSITRSAAMVRTIAHFVDRLQPVYDPLALHGQRMKLEGEIAAEQAEAIANGALPDRPPVLSGALWGPDHNMDAKPHVLVSLLGEWQDRLVKYSKLAIDAGVEERRIQLAENTGRVLVQVLQGVLADLGVANHPDLPRVLGVHLRAIDTTGVPA